MLTRSTLQNSAYEYMHVIPLLLLVLLTIFVAIGKQRISGNIIRASVLVYSSMVLTITYVGFIDPHMVDDLGVGPLLRWAFASIFLAPQFLASVFILYTNAIGYRFPANGRGFYRYSTALLVSIGWSWFIIFGIDQAG